MKVAVSRVQRLRRLMAAKMAGHQRWALVTAVVLMTIIHYLAPVTRSDPPVGRMVVNRHAIERVLFLLPVAAATVSLGQKKGLLTLAVAVFVMLPRAVWPSANPMGPAPEIIAVAVVGCGVLWTVGRDERERSIHREAVARMRAFNAVCSIVARSLDLEQVISETLDKVLEVTDLEIGLMYSMDRQTEDLMLCAHRGIAQRTAAALNHVRLGEGLYAQVAKSGEPMVLEQLPQAPHPAASAMHGEGVRSQIIVPLTSKGEVHGIMALGSRQDRRFPPGDVQLIATFGRQIGVGVENAQLHRDVERQLEIQQRLNEVAEKITSELELDRILPKVLEISEGLIGADCGFIALFDPATKQLRYPYLHNLPQSLMDIRVAEGEGVAGEAMTAAAPVSIADYRHYPNAVPEFLNAGLVSVVAVPIVSGNRSFGTLAAGSLHDAKRFSPAEISSLAGVGRQAGIAIDNARLYESMRYYAGQITRAQERERKRIAREAHDETAQILVALSWRLDALLAWPDPPSAAFRERLKGVRELSTEALQSVRRFSHDLRPPVLDDLGFVAAVRGLTRALVEMSVKAEVEVLGIPYRLSADEELVLFRIAQEALNNIRRHADASEVRVTISFDRNKVHMGIEDNGEGFDAPPRFADLVASGNLGLIGMHERARLLGGDISSRFGTRERYTNPRRYTRSPESLASSAAEDQVVASTAQTVPPWEDIHVPA